MRYLSILLLASLMLCTSCNDEAGSSKNEPAKETAGADSTAANQEQTTNPEPPAEGPQEGAYEMEGKYWVLSKYTYEGNLERPVGEDPIHITIEGNRLTGNGGCNNINGEVTLGEDGAVSISNIASTKKLCGGLMIQETRIIQLLEGAQSYKVNMVFLEFSGPEGQLTFRNDLE